MGAPGSFSEGFITKLRRTPSDGVTRLTHYRTCMRERARVRVRARVEGRYVLPAVMATGNIHSGIIAGKLNGVMPAHTPSGSLYE